MEAQQAGAVHPKGTDPLSKELMAIAAAKDEENSREKQGKADPVPDDEGVYEAEVVAEESARPAWPAVAQPRS